jgi:hypothetical protein
MEPGTEVGGFGNWWRWRQMIITPVALSDGHECGVAMLTLTETGDADTDPDDASIWMVIVRVDRLCGRYRLRQ